MKLFLKKGMTLTLGVFLLFAIIACGEETTTTENESGDIPPVPALSEPDGVFYETDDYQVSYGEIYDEFKTQNGLSELLAMVDGELLVDYFDDITEDMMNDKRNKLMFNTTDPDKLAEFADDERADALEAYENTLYLKGYSGDSEDDYLRLLIARDLYAKDTLDDSDYASEDFYITVDAITDFYENEYFEDATAFLLRFLSKADASEMFDEYNLISYRDGTIREYTGERPIEEVPSSGFDDDNTAVLNDAELLDVFIGMYNDLYGAYRETIATGATTGDLEDIEGLNVSYDDLNAVNADLASFVFAELPAMSDDDSDVPPYTYKPMRYYYAQDSFYYLILNVNKAEKVDLSGFDGDKSDLESLLTTEVYDEVLDVLQEKTLTDQFIAQRMAELRSDHGFTINDYYLGIDYQRYDADYENTETGHESIVATYDDVTITADDFFAQAMEKNAALYTIYAAIDPLLMDTYFTDVYCPGEDTCDFESAGEKMDEHRDLLDQLETQFGESQLVLHYTFGEYLYLAYGAKSKDDMIKEYYVKSVLQPYLIFEDMMADDHAVLSDYLYPLIEKNYNHYFNLDVTHLLIYVDRDEDGTPDDRESFVEGLDDVTAYENKLAAFEIAIRDYLNDDHTLLDFVEMYDEVSLNDADFGPFKRYGFMVKRENLTQSTSLTYAKAQGSFDSAFVDALEDMYNDYVLSENEDKDSMLSTELVKTVFGNHLIRVEKGNMFERPSATFIMSYDDEQNPLFDEGFVNVSDKLTLEQLILMTRADFTEIVDENPELIEAIYGFEVPEVPEELDDVRDAFVTESFRSLFVQGYLNMLVIDDLKAGTLVNETSSYAAIDETRLMTLFDEIYALYDNQVFDNLDEE